MVGGRLDEKEVGAHVRDANGGAIDDQSHLYLGRMSAVILFRYHEPKKMLRWPDAYEREKKVYERLRDAAVATVLGFNVPQLVGSDDGLRVLEITIVEPPFVLDFAGAHLDRRPEFPEEVWADWEAEKREQFEGRWPAVQAVLDAFEELGVYLLDLSPSNIAFLD